MKKKLHAALKESAKLEESWRSDLRRIEGEARLDLIGQSVVAPKGEGIFSDKSVFRVDEDGILCGIDYEDGSKGIVILVKLEDEDDLAFAEDRGGSWINPNIRVSGHLQAKLEEWFDGLSAVRDEKRAEELAADEAEKAAKLRAAEEASFRKKAERFAAKMDSLGRGEGFGTDPYMEAVGWLIGGRLRAISATYPDYGRWAFDRRFGSFIPDQGIRDIYVKELDGKKRGPSGHLEIWDMGVRISLRRMKSKAELPEYIAKNSSGSNDPTKYYDTQFAYSIMEGYGFAFGGLEDQDLAAIEGSIGRSEESAYRAGFDKARADLGLEPRDWDIYPLESYPKEEWLNGIAK